MKRTGGILFSPELEPLEKKQKIDSYHTQTSIANESLSPLAALPQDLIYNIFFKLIEHQSNGNEKHPKLIHRGFKTHIKILNCQLVCNEWFQIINTDKFLMTYINMNCIPLDVLFNEEKLINCIKNNQKQITSLNFIDKNISTENQMDLRFLDKDNKIYDLILKCNNLNLLRLPPKLSSEYSLTDLKETGLVCNSVKHLIVDSIGVFTDDAMSAIGTCFPKVNSIKMSMTPPNMTFNHYSFNPNKIFEAMSHSLVELKILDLSQAPIPLFFLKKNKMDKYNNIEELNLSNNISLNDEKLEIILDHCQKLQTVKLSNTCLFFNLTDRKIYPNITSLDITHIHNSINLENFKKITTCFHHLQKLSCDKQPFIRVSHLIHLLKKLNSLTSLSIRPTVFCPLTLEEIVLPISLPLQKLEFTNIKFLQFCDRQDVTDFEMSTLLDRCIELKKLKIIETNVKFLEWNNTVQSYPNLRELDFTNTVLTIDGYQQLSLRFPKLVKLTCDINSTVEISSLSKLYNLRFLTIFSSGNDGTKEEEVNIIKNFPSIKYLEYYCLENDQEACYVYKF